MRYLKITALFAITFSALHAHSQSLEFRDLLGNWKNTKGAEVSYEFLDSVNARINSVNHGVSNATYHLKRDGQHYILEIEVSDNSIKKQSTYYIKKFNGTYMRLENTDTYDPVIQTKPVETGLWLVKQKL